MVEQTQLQGLDVTITTTMQVLGVVVALALQFIKAFTVRWAALTDDMRKALWPLVSIGLTMLCFWLGKVDNWLIAGVVVGLSACGGYDWFAGASKLGAKAPPVVPMLLLGVLLIGLSGCADKIITPQEQLEFGMFNVRVQDWNEQCRADPNQCAAGLANMAAEMQQWTKLIVGEPNNLGVTP